MSRLLSYVASIYILCALQFLMVLAGCNVNTQSFNGKFNTNIADGDFLLAWNEIISSVPALQKGEAFLAHLYNNYVIDGSGCLSAFSFDVIIDENLSELGKVYYVNITNTSYSVKFRSTETNNKRGVPIFLLMTTLKQVSPSKIIEMSPQKGNEYFIQTKIVSGREIISNQYIIFRLPSYQVSNSVVTPLTEPFITETGGIVLSVSPINLTGPQEYALFLFLSFPL